MTARAVLIAGPTASGKSAAALAIAESIGGAVINADSMQIYRELRILTARPSEADMARVPHFLYGHVSAREPYSVGRYRADAVRALAEARALGKIPVIAGGTGLYFSALTEGLADIPPVPQVVRDAAREKLARIGVVALHAELAARDPDGAAALRPSDPQRVLRAYEVLEATGRSLLQWQRHAGEALLGVEDAARFVLDVPREELRARIDTRFRQMIADGAREEAALLCDLDPALPAAKILGLRELNAARSGQMSLEEASAEAVTRTRQFAKRQVTWFRHRMTDWNRVSAANGSNFVSGMLRSLA
jgi:tRNA dimethylallyltransferase